MKHAILLPAVFLYMATSAQQAADSNKNNLPAYNPAKFEGLKKIKSPGSVYKTEDLNSFYSFTLSKPDKPSFSFKGLQNYLSQDVSYFRTQQKQKEWTQFASATFSSWTKQNWMMNKNNVQQNWMRQKMKGK